MDYFHNLLRIMDYSDPPPLTGPQYVKRIIVHLLLFSKNIQLATTPCFYFLSGKIIVSFGDLVSKVI